MILGYARVSTEEQSLNVQIDALNNYGCDTIYKEKVSSRKDRPELESCLKALSENPGSHKLVIYKLDRLSRSLLDLKIIVDKLQKLDCKLVSIKDKFNTSTAEGRLFFNMLGVFAEFERDLISQRTKASLKSAKKRGVKLGRPEYLDRSKVRGAKKLKKQGFKNSFIMNELNISRATLYRYLK